MGLAGGAAELASSFVWNLNVFCSQRARYGQTGLLNSSATKKKRKKHEQRGAHKCCMLYFCIFAQMNHEITPGGFVLNVNRLFWCVFPVAGHFMQ